MSQAAELKRGRKASLETKCEKGVLETLGMAPESLTFVSLDPSKAGRGAENT